MLAECNCHQCSRDRGEFRKTDRVCPKCKKGNCPKSRFHSLRCTDSDQPGQIGVEE